MKYMLLIYGNQEAWDDLTASGRETLDAAHRDVLAELTASGEIVLSNELGVEDAKIVRRSDEGLLVTDGPFAEVREMVGGFYIVDVASLDRAVELAGRLEETTFSLVEVRPLLH